jgi:hypothetical protein
MDQGVLKGHSSGICLQGISAKGFWTAVLYGAFAVCNAFFPLVNQRPEAVTLFTSLRHTSVMCLPVIIKFERL